MSAYLCDSPHVSACADIILILKRKGYLVVPGLPESAEAIFTVLLNENLKSLHSRYPDDTKAWDEDSLFYVYEAQDVRDHIIVGDGRGYLPEAVTYYSALKCLAYQSCEHEGWHESEACKAIDQAMALLASTIIRALPQWEAAPWGWKSKPLPMAFVRRG